MTITAEIYGLKQLDITRRGYRQLVLIAFFIKAAVAARNVATAYSYMHLLCMNNQKFKLETATKQLYTQNNDRSVKYALRFCLVRLSACTHEYGSLYNDCCQHKNPYQ